jgi:hypothetical protein
MKLADETELQDPSTPTKGGEQGKEVDPALASYCNIDRCNIAPGHPLSKASPHPEGPFTDQGDETAITRYIL